MDPAIDFQQAYTFSHPPGYHFKLFYLGFTVQDNVIRTMGVLGIEQAPAFHLPVLMDTYGQPGSVWVNAYSGSARNYGPRQVTIHVFYPKLGFMAQYDAPGGEMVNGILRNCFVKGPSLHFFVPDEQLRYQDFVKTLALDFQFPFLPVSEALGMDENSFYQTYKGADREVCLETPLEIWLWDVTPTPTP